eukprot:scaffold119847_cov37-Attheya_sp.AAC.1
MGRRHPNQGPHQEPEDPLTKCPPGTIFVDFWCVTSSFKDDVATNTRAFDGTDAENIIHTWINDRYASTHPMLVGPSITANPTKHENAG